MPKKSQRAPVRRGKPLPKKAKVEVSSQVRLALEQSRRWAEDYVKIQNKHQKSYLNSTRRGVVVMTPEQLTNLVQWVHYCGGNS